MNLSNYSGRKLLIGGQALKDLGSSRNTLDTDYLISTGITTDMFIKDVENNTDYVNANGHPFFAKVWESEKSNKGPIASPQSLLELKAYSFVQHCHLGFWQKADDAEYDIKFLVRHFNLKEIKIACFYMGSGELEEVNKVIQSVRK